MKILVCITHVPDTTAKISFSNDNSEFNKTGVSYIIGPYDDYALARSVELKEQHGGEITVLHVGEAESEPTIRKALAIGADKAIRINTHPKDSFFVAQEIANIVKSENFDLIMMGRESIDFNSGVVHNMVGELTDIPSISPVMKLEINDGVANIEKEIEGGKQSITAKLPLVLGCQEPISEWKIPNMRGIMTARTKPLEVREPVGNQNFSEVTSFSLPPEKADCKLIEPNNVEELVQLLRNEAKVL